MTTNAFKEECRQVLEYGMKAHIAKPINVEKLLEILTDILKETNAV